MEMQASSAPGMVPSLMVSKRNRAKLNLGLGWLLLVLWPIQNKYTENEHVGINLKGNERVKG